MMNKDTCCDDSVVRCSDIVVITAYFGQPFEQVLWGNAVLMRRQSCWGLRADDMQAPASSWRVLLSRGETVGQPQW